MSKGGATWRRFQLVVSKNDAAPAAALLETATGALSATEMAAAKAIVSVYTPRKDATNARTRITRLLSTARRKRVFCAARLSENAIREEDWASSWKRFYRPSRIAPGLYVVPSWEKDFRTRPPAQVVRMDPGMAFGTGQHPSTRLALAFLLPQVKPGNVVVDVGCGSGILAIAAAQRRAFVYASDADPIAINATKANFRANQVHAVEVRRARGVPESFPRANVIIANISARVIVHMAPALSKKLKRGGRLILSGFGKRSRHEITTAMREVGLHFVAERSRRPWLAHLYAKRLPTSPRRQA